MPKAGGNFYPVRDALPTYWVNQLRFFLLNRHYRMDMDIRGIDSAAKTYNRLRGMAEKCRRAVGGASKEYDEKFLQHFCDAMNDDFDTPLALRTLGEGLASTSNTRSATAAARKLASIRLATSILGVDLGLG